MGHQDERLRQLLEQQRANLVEENRQQQREEQLGGKEEQVEAQGIERHAQPVVAAEEECEVVEAGPGTAEDALRGAKAFERDKVAEHWHVREDDQKDNAG